MAEPAQPEALPSPVPLRPAARPSPTVPLLPTPLTAIVGRAREVDAVQALLMRDDVRLVTLTGPGGVGKSRIAIEAASALAAAFPDGIVLVPLAPLTDPDAVLATIASVLGVRDVGERTTLATLQTALRSRRLLLLLDSFEPVLAAAPALAELLRACPRLKALVTSRARLRIHGERVLPLAPLALPDTADDVPERLLAAPAVALFMERARDLQPDFALTAENSATVGEIVRRLDGLPLAIELAAARLDLFRPAALLARLERRLLLLTGGAHDLPERQQTMRAAIAWSYDLLPPDRQRTFQRLAVCRGSFSVAAAAACAGLDEAATLDELAVLAEQNLVQRVESDGGAPEAGPRFNMLDTIREFAEDQLVACGEDLDVRRRHAAYFLSLAEEAGAELRVASRVDWMARLDREREQLRATLAWTLANEPQWALSIAGTLWIYWYHRGRLSEYQDWAERALAAAPAPSAARARALYAAGQVGIFQGDHQTALARLLEARDLARSLGDSQVNADILFALGVEAEDRGDYDEGHAYLSEALDLFHALEDHTWVALLTYHLSVVAYGRGELVAARAMIDEALRLATNDGDGFVEIICLAFLALMQTDAGEHVAAASALVRCLEADLASDYPEVVASDLAIAASLASARDEPALAVRLFAAAASLNEAFGVAVPLPERDRFDGALASAHATLGANGFAAAHEAGRAILPRQATEEAMAFLRRVAGGEADRSLVAGRVGETLAGSPPKPDLTARELEVLRLLASGHTNPEIASALYISPGTVRIHVSHILAKLDARTRTEAAANARRRGLL
jgi:predicted ATPase/DNA-binding CsgD family transcriptional regulator